MSFLQSDAFIFVLMLILFSSLLPFGSIFSAEPATGGDTGSHFFPLHNILKIKTLRPWNPGNLAGEPQLVHYFPFSFILMALFSIIFPAGLVFNWLSILPTFLLPFAIYRGLKQMRSPGATALLAAALSVPFILNTSYSAWGGNLLSTLAGQFAHAYALNFFFLFVGALYQDLELRRIPLRSGFFAACVVLSHAYIAMALPIASLGLLLLFENQGLWPRLKIIAGAGLLGSLLSVWWLIPSLQSNAWTTPYASSWLDHLGVGSYLPPSFLFYAALVPLLLSSLLSNDRGRSGLLKTYGLHLCFWFLLAIFYTHLVWAFPQLGLVDIRAIPQIQIFAFVFIALLVAAFADILPGNFKNGFVILACVCVVFQGYSMRGSAKKWLKWNWSGWSSKELSKDFKAVNEGLRGDASMGRVVFEHSAVQNGAGTIRAFEMLPYFSGRSTLESLYMQATVLAPAAFYMQSLVGESHSCPFPDLPCGSLNLARAADYFSILGVQQLILSSKKAVAEAQKMPKLLKFEFKHGPWSVFEYTNKVDLAEVMHEKPLFSDASLKDWKAESFKKLVEYKPNDAWIVNRNLVSAEILSRLETWTPPQSSDCGVGLKVMDQKMELNTRCAGQPHVVKMSYNPSFRADSGDPLFPVYPGYIGIFPSTESVVIRFGAAPLWKFFDAVSFLSWTGLAVVFLKGLLKSPKWRKLRQKISS